MSDHGEAALNEPAPETSTDFLATVLLYYIGLDGGEYFNYLSELKKTIPVITSRFYKVNGVYTEKLSQNTKDELERYRKLQYYMLMEKEAISP